MKNLKGTAAVLVGGNIELADINLTYTTTAITEDYMLSDIFDAFEGYQILAMNVNDSSVNELWDTVSRESAQDRATIKATCTQTEYEKIVALEEKIEEARTMLKNDTLKGNAEEKVEEVVNATFEQVEAELKEAQESVEDALRLVPEGTIKEIIKAKDHEAYKVMLDGFNETLDRLRKYAGNTGAFKTMESKFAEAKIKVDTFLDKHGKTEKVLSILGQLIRKIAAVILGLAKFAVDTVAILATMVLRVSVAVAEEVVDSSKAIGSSFNKNIFGLFRKNK